MSLFEKLVIGMALGAVTFNALSHYEETYSERAKLCFSRGGTEYHWIEGTCSRRVQQVDPIDMR